MKTLSIRQVRHISGGLLEPALFTEIPDNTIPPDQYPRPVVESLLEPPTTTPQPLPGYRGVRLVNVRTDLRDDIF